DRIEIDETDLSAISFKFPPALRSGDVVYKAVGLSAGYPGKVVFTDADIEIKRGEKIAFVGRNGEGKTTQLRVIHGELSPLDGESKVGHNVAFGYYAQNQEDILDKNATVWETVDRIAVGEIRTKLRDLLAGFLFKGEDIDKKVSVLSGGERARLGMAKLMLGTFNCLLLDEPTNHMDIRSKEMLKKALKAYDGTLIVVSHDRDFLDGLVDRLYVFRDGRVKDFPGNINDFLDTLDDAAHQQPVKTQAQAPAQAAQPAQQQKGAGAYQALKSENKEQKKIKNRIAFLEKESDKLSQKMKELEAKLSAPTEKDDIMELTRQYLELKRDLDAKTQEWEKLIETM
ncbi:MAG: ABC-F family ATP-binding cassette domain-containing protein, partial [Lachnospiraceae bacterium]|nr:ABC-F family ATP-binding cassette domain-containing protein [Lachnospiraceae bacterium]